MNGPYRTAEKQESDDWVIEEILSTEELTHSRFGKMTLIRFREGYCKKDYLPQTRSLIGLPSKPSLKMKIKINPISEIGIPSFETSIDNFHFMIKLHNKILGYKIDE
jgi:hypothetical protein